MTRKPHFDFVYVSSYNECDTGFIRGLSAAFAARGMRFAVAGYVSTYVESLIRGTGVEFFNLRRPGPLVPLPAADWPQLEDRIGQPLSSFCFPEQRYYMTAPAKLAARAKALLDGYEDLLDHISIGCFLHKLGAELVRRMASVIGERRGGRTLYLSTFPAQFAGRTFLHSKFWSERDDPVAPHPNTGDAISFEQFSAMLDDVRHRRQVIHYPLTGNRGWNEAFAMVWSMMRNRESEFLLDIASRQRELLRFRVRNIAASLASSRRLPNTPFYFFPLHVFDDSQITVRNPHFYDQAWVIEMIERSLPAGMKLVVKMHPGLDGAVPIAFLQRMRKLKRLHLLDARVNAHDVVRKSNGVIVINSTVALEALIHEKPVYVLGHWTFGNLGLTRQMEDFRRLPEDLLALRHDRVEPGKINRVLYDLFGEMARFSYNRAPIDYDAMVRALASGGLRDA